MTATEFASPITFIEGGPAPVDQAAAAGIDTSAAGAVGTPGVAGPNTSMPGIASAVDAVDPSAYQPPGEVEVADKETFITQYLGPTTSMFGADGALAKGKTGNLVAAAQSYLGIPYVWGGNGYGGVDCSGLVQQVFRSQGIELPRLSSQQANAGARVSLKDLRPGDLVAWDNSTRNHGADHIAIYIGNGQIIEAPRPGLNVRTRALGANEGDAWGVRLSRGN